MYNQETMDLNMVIGIPPKLASKKLKNMLMYLRDKVISFFFFLSTKYELSNEDQ